MFLDQAVRNIILSKTKIGPKKDRAFNGIEALSLDFYISPS